MPYGIGFTNMIIIQIIFFIFTIGLIIWITKSSQGTIESAKERLDKRLVNGEISSKEYDLLLKKIV